MPYGDRTGPWGTGPMTGRGAGYCGGFDAPGFANPRGGRMGLGRGWGGGRGFGRGGGFGAGHGRRFAGGGWRGWSVPWPRVAEADERSYLEQEAEALQSRLDAISQRLESLKKTED